VIYHGRSAETTLRGLARRPDARTVVA